MERSTREPRGSIGARMTPPPVAGEEGQNTARSVNEEGSRLFSDISREFLEGMPAVVAPTYQQEGKEERHPFSLTSPTLTSPATTGAGALPQRPQPSASASRRGMGPSFESKHDEPRELKRFGSAVAVDIAPSQTSPVTASQRALRAAGGTQQSQHTRSHESSLASSTRSLKASQRNIDLDAENVDLDALLHLNADDVLRLQAKQPRNKVRQGEDDDQAELAELRTSVLGEIPAYMDEFEQAVAGEEIVVGWIPEDSLRGREEQLAEERRKEREEEERRHYRKEEILRVKEEEAKARVLKEKAELASRIKRRQAESTDAAEARSAALHRTFRRAQAELRSTLAKQHALVSEKYGRLVPGRAGARLLRIEWHKLPQPIEIRISRLRAVKNKLPSGRYVLLVTLYDRLGGNPLRWTKVGFSGGGDSSRPGATTPVRHRGRFYDTEVPFNQCVYAVAPSQADLRPSHVFIMELFLLGGRSNPIDRVVAWTALPACDRDFQVVWGRYKLPLLRGEVDLAIDKYKAVETSMEKDLDSWLANLYVEVVHLPRETIKDGVTHREFDVEIAYTSELLRIRGEYRTPKRWGAGVKLGDGQGGVRKRMNKSNGQLENIMEEENENDDVDDADGADSEASDGSKGEVDSDGNPIEEDELGIGLGWDDEDNMDEMIVGMATGAVNADADWGEAADVEAEDHYAGGPPIVSDRVTRDTVMALGPVGEVTQVPAGKAGIRAARAAQAKQNYMAAQQQQQQITAQAAEKAQQVKGPRAQAQQQADYWRARAANANALPPTGMQAGASTGISSKARDDPRLQIDESADGDDEKSSLLAPKAPKLGAAFAAEAARSKNIIARAAATFKGKSLQPPVGTAVNASMPGASNTAPQAKAAAASALATGGGLASYTYALNKQEGKGLRGARVRESVRKLRFLQYEMVADLSPGSAKTFDFWIQFVLLLIALWLRIYIHYLGQWLFLRSLRIPVYEFSPLAYSATLKYVPDVLPNEYEIGVVIMGPISVTIVFAIFMSFSWLCQAILGHFPEIPSRFIAFFGFAAFIDPALIVAVDAAAGRYNCAARFEACAVNIASAACTCSDGDAWKLYNRFLQEEGSGVIGIVLTVFLYIVLMIMALFFVYMYLLHLHLNGRMIDLFRRLHAEEHKFLVPHDFEVSPQELQWIVSRAQRWRGPHGTTRKIAVCDYVLTDPLDANFREKTTHLIIYHAGLDGGRELYRHFLRLPDGTVLEVFGSMERQLGLASGVGTSALQELLMTHGKDSEADAGAAVNNFFAGL